MEITKERWNQLGLGCEKEGCELYLAGECHGELPDIIAPCIDPERLKSEMTEEEYDAWRHNRLYLKS